MSIRGSNFENQHPFASDHALVWAHCMPDGLLYGVDMSFTPTLFTLGTGFMLVAGRMFEITTAENISINPGNGYARVYAQQARTVLTKFLSAWITPQTLIVSRN